MSSNQSCFHLFAFVWGSGSACRGVWQKFSALSCLTQFSYLPCEFWLAWDREFKRELWLAPSSLRSWNDRIAQGSSKTNLWITPLPFTHTRNFWWQVSPVNKRSKPGYIQRPFPGDYAAHEEWNSFEFHTTDLHLTRGFCYCKQHDAVSFVDVLLIPHSQFTPGFHLINGVRHKGEILIG